ncbi:MAG: DUF2949 domain-containing protein [Leptolyngbyaceae cyanobacterium bins.302]|nr:DUF2949 domain-containing protein [Leptolyngbyaceae cyanobacterium bins.302]
MLKRQGGAVNARLIQFLKEELAVPETSLAIALRHQDSTTNQLPIILWQYGLITLQDLDRIFDWLESTAA